MILYKWFVERKAVIRNHLEEQAYSGKKRIAIRMSTTLLTIGLIMSLSFHLCWANAPGEGLAPLDPLVGM
jgi:hypothetical protein